MIKWLFSGWKTLPKISALEGFLSRFLFSIFLLYTLRLSIDYTQEPHPVGLLKLLHGINDGKLWLTWLADPSTWNVYRAIFAGLLVIYVAGVALPLVLPVLALMHVLPFTLYNSQGFTHHGYQIVSCTLIIQAIAVLYYNFREKFTLAPPDEKLRAWMFVQAQVILTGMYFISVFTKLDNSGGMWLWNSNNVAMDMLKTARQSFLNNFDPAFAGNPPEAIWMLEHPWLSRLFFGSGLFLEFLCIFAIGNRVLGFLLGISLLVMHRSIDWLMGGVAFINNEFLAFIFLVNLPFLLSWPADRISSGWVRKGLVAGATVGLFASFWLHPGGSGNNSFVNYGWSVVKSIEVWNSLSAEDWRKFLNFATPIALTVVGGGLSGAVTGAVAGLFAHATNREKGQAAGSSQ
ncbi:hypothetical protein [Verrucomicrobium sp. BvORR106]|uniref:hypothetical protein n=1 Tax=Verrucomicrobium sp. BvORR106 TaxID=1403819 RepID=UPI0005703745|nr:hypothetical protein [Verrucomicrobium sp. BvORR106]